MKRIICLIIAITINMMLSQNVCAQTTGVSFTYDLNGNRTSRSIIVVKASENDRNNDSNDWINMSLYPNPTCGSLILSTDMTQQNNLIIATILSLNGNVIEEKTITRSVTEFDLTGYSIGVYFLIINYQNEKRVWKVIKTQ